MKAVDVARVTALQMSNCPGCAGGAPVAHQANTLTMGEAVPRAHQSPEQTARFQRAYAAYRAAEAAREAHGLLRDSGQGAAWYARWWAARTPEWWTERDRLASVAAAAALEMGHAALEMAGSHCADCHGPEPYHNDPVLAARVCALIAEIEAAELE